MPPEDESHKPALHDQHVALDARMAPEAGWRMPLSYRGALDEAVGVRRRAGVFDVSHCGRIRIRGDGALDLLERACSCDVVHQEDDTSETTLLCNDRGGIIDCGRLIRLSDFWVLVTSPPCREKVLTHLQELAEQYGAKVDDQTDKTTMLVAAGPATAGILDAVLPFDVSDLPAGAVKFGSILIARYIAERVDLTGEWGVAVSIPDMMAGQAWKFVTQGAGEHAIPPAGLAALDVLRIEAGLPRYGHELNETIDPVTAGLAGAVHFEHDFIGRDALATIREKGPARQLVGLVPAAPSSTPTVASIPRSGTAVSTGDGSEVGAVTSATYSPTLEKVIAMAYVDREAAEAGTALCVQADPPCEANVVDLPFVGK